MHGQTPSSAILYPCPAIAGYLAGTTRYCLPSMLWRPDLMTARNAGASRCDRY